MAESRYDKYVGHPGSFIILTARILLWPAGTGWKAFQVTGMDLKCACYDYGAPTFH